MNSIRRRLMLVDALTIFLVTSATYLYFPNGLWFFQFGISPGIKFQLSPAAQSVLAGVSWLLSLQISGVYASRNWRNPAYEYPAFLRATLIAGGLISAFSVAFKADLARGMLFSNLLLGFIALLLVRQLLSLVFSQVSTLSNRLRTRRHSLLVGPKAQLAAVQKRIRDSRLSSIDLVGTMPLEKFTQSKLADRIDAENIAYVLLVGVDNLPANQFREINEVVEQSTADMFVLTSLPNLGAGRIEPHELAGEAGFFVAKPEFVGFQRITKRAGDIFGSILIAILLAIPLAIIALLIKREDRGPVLFWQERVGRDGKTFRMAKFRSMRVGAEEEYELVKATSGSVSANQILFKSPTDPRVTRVGAFIRRWSIDELAQLINVVRGEMSLVGPRPPLDSEVRQFSEDAMRRFKVKPGMTGLWQISGRADLSWEQSVKLDLYYVENWSTGLDLYILLRTLKAVITREGAY